MSSRLILMSGERLCVSVRIVLGLMFAVVLALSACLTDQSDDRRAPQASQSVTTQPTSTPRPTATPTPQPTPTPDTSLEPTVGMLAAVPIGRMLMQCWKKEGKVNKRSFATVSCEAVDAHRQLYIEAWVNPEEPKEEREVSVSFIYFAEIGSDRVDYMQCEDITMSRGVTTKERGELLLGTCNRQLHSYQDALLMLQRSASDWTAYSGLAEPTSQDDIRVILEPLKR